MFRYGNEKLRNSDQVFGNRLSGRVLVTPKKKDEEMSLTSGHHAPVQGIHTWVFRHFCEKSWGSEIADVPKFIYYLNLLGVGYGAGVKCERKYPVRDTDGMKLLEFQNNETERRELKLQPPSLTAGPSRNEFVPPKSAEQVLKSRQTKEPVERERECCRRETLTE
ncbi:unnamed protein product [Allacma fusca]|uniref:Uncharacterized protein n=1 Tax=Allacma fusca TaxID=39272 RepID=A0A8J2NSC6_9HEXA|nr:unnamed protein product [Allacma fusca]